MTNEKNNFKKTGISKKLDRALTRALNVIEEYENYLADMGVHDDEKFLQESGNMIREALELVQ